MRQAIAADQVEYSSAVQGYSGAVLSSAAEIQSLQPLIAGILPRNDILCRPDFFLASLSQGWMPRVVAVHQESGLAGVVFAKERILHGLRLGVVYGDLTFGSVMAGGPLQQQTEFLVAMETLLASPGIRGIRLRVRRYGPELPAIRRLLAAHRPDACFTRVRDHASLSLPATYERLLLSFGSTTRHNFRYYRRRFEAAGHMYLEDLTLDELRSAAYLLAPKCGWTSRSGSIDRLLKMTAAADRPLAVGLRHRNGEWLSVVGGVYRPNAGVLLLQLNNDRDFPRDSLSVVLRGYLIESLIRQGMREFIIWAGTAPPLARYVTYIPTLGIYLDSPDHPWRLVRGLVSGLGPWLPKRCQPDARWIAPFST